MPHHFVYLDGHDINRVYARVPRMTPSFRNYVGLVALFELLLIGLSVGTLLVRFEWTVFLHALTVPRFFLLVFTLCRRHDVLTMMGTDDWWKVGRYLSYYWELGVWYWLGALDLPVRFACPLVDGIYLGVHGHALSGQMAFYLVVDLLYIVEYFVGIYLIYYRGVLRNIVTTMAPKHPYHVWRPLTEGQEQQEERGRARERKKAPQ